MHKLLWVALPLLLAAAWLLVQVLRRRRPSRQALNAWSSLLLMAYLLTTAGLGVFWVANQQLPVFDWHYLFGYGTVLLVTVHLSLNLRMVWRYLGRRGKGRPTGATSGAALGMPPRHDAAAAVHPGRYTADQAGRARTRRVVVACAGLPVVGGLAYFAYGLGRRHGAGDGAGDGVTRSARGARWPVSGPGAVRNDMALVERFHAVSSHSRAGILTGAPAVAWGPAPPAFKLRTGHAAVALPPIQTRGEEATGAIGSGWDVAELGIVLWHTVGITARRGGLLLRASPSSGGLFSTELYVIAHAVRGLPVGVWHYEPRRHALERLAAPLPSSVAQATEAALGPASDTVAAHLVATAVFRRTGHKYRDRAYRYVLADLGHALENLRVAVAALGKGMRLLPAFEEARVAAMLGVDEAEEGVLALATLAGDAARGDAGRGPVPALPAWQPARLEERHSGAPLGLTSAIHRASSLQGRTSSSAQPAPGASVGEVAQAIALPRPPQVHADTLALIAARRSVRRFAAAPLPQDALAAVLLRLTGVPGVLSTAVRIHVVVHAVQGLAPAAYRYERAAHALSPRRAQADLRGLAGAAALDQDVIAQAAAVFVLSVDRATLAADPLGAARAYRHAYIEAGLLGERIYLEAQARGLGACSVGAFYDDEAAALVGLDPAAEWVVHFSALGVPAA